MLFISFPKNYFIFSCHHPHCNTCQPQTDRNRKTGWQESILALRSWISLVASPWTTLTSHFSEAAIAFKVKCNPTATLEIWIAELWKPCCFWQQQYPQLCTIHIPYSLLFCAAHTHCKQEVGAAQLLASSVSRDCHETEKH